MLCQCWSYFFHWTNIDKMSNILVLYQCHFKTCSYNVTLTSYQWLYQHWNLNILLRCCKSTHTKRGQVCDGICYLQSTTMIWKRAVGKCRVRNPCARGFRNVERGENQSLWRVFEFIKNCEFSYLNDFSTREEPLVLWNKSE